MEEKNSNNLEKRKNYFLFVFFALFMFFVGALTTRTGCDYQAHREEVEKITFKLLSQPLVFIKELYYPLWHLMVKCTMRLFNMSIEYATEIVCGFLVLITYIQVYRYYEKESDMDDKCSIFFAFVASVVGPFFMPWYNPYYYIGQSSPNVWHSPTALVIRPIAFACFWFIIRVLKQKETAIKEYILIALLLLLSNLAKPSFVQILYPTLFIYCIVKVIVSKGKYFKTAFLLFLACVPALLFTIFQYIVAFFDSEGAGGTEFAFLKYWDYEAPDVLTSLILGILFPLIVFIRLMIRKKVSLEMAIGWIMLLVGILEKACLIEKGDRIYAGNFSWGYQLALFFVWVLTIYEYAKNYYSSKNVIDGSDRIWFKIETIVLMFHFMFGLRYIYTFVIMNNII